MDEQLTGFFEKLARRPSILLLGQNYLHAPLAEVSFVRLVSEHFQISLNPEQPFLSQLADKLEHLDLSGSLRWLHRRSETVPISESLHLLSEFPWSNVYTSAIDEIWTRAFKKPWRSLNRVFNELSYPLEPRDRNILCSTFLYGCVDQEDADSKIATGTFQLDEKSQHAVTLVRRLPEILTPLGILAIEGYDPEADFLKSKELYPIVNSLALEQAVLFSVGPAVYKDKYLAKLHKDGKLIFVNQSLADSLKQAVAEGIIRLGDPAVKLPGGRQITINGQSHAIPKDLWLNLSGIATILDDNIFVPPRVSSPAQEYVEFRNFLAEPVKSNSWSGFSKGFVFERDFERLLHSECERRLKSTRLQLDPILVRGESGTGKTVAMAHVAYTIGSEYSFPTLFIERSVSNPDWRPIDRFLNWAEDCGASSCLIIWDGMRGEDQYVALQRKLADRGRKAVVVGTTYYATEISSKILHIEAPRDLNFVEKAAFKEYLSRFNDGLAEQVSASAVAIDSTFLVALYRLLPTTRPRLTKGITSELEHAGKDIFEKIKSAETQNAPLNSLETAFRHLGIFSDPDHILNRQDDEASIEQSPEVRDLLSLVMVPGKYGFDVPIELLLGALGKPINSTTITALQTTVLRWSEKPNGEILVAPRHPLEARMYIDSLYAGAAEAEADLICKLLYGLKRGHGGEVHIDFVVDLLRHVGPNSPVERNKRHFQRCILKFAESLTSLRQKKSVLSPRLMLQEAAFYRESVRANESYPTTEKMRLLQCAEDVLLSAKDRGDCPAALKSSINAELAACYGSMIYTLESDKNNQMDIVSLYARAKDALREAVRRDWANAHAVVTLGWISRSVLDSTILGEAERCDIVAELMFRFDEAIPSSMDTVQQEYFFKERIRVMEKLGQSELAEKTFEDLRTTGSKAGYYLRARSYFADFPEEEATSRQKADLAKAEGYLRDNWTEIFTDERCLGLYLKVWWFIHAGQQMLSKERQILPFTDTQWNRLKEVTSKLKELKGPDCPAWLKFLGALSAFHTGDIGIALLEFREMSSDPNLQAGGNRLKKYFVASSNGKARTFDGSVRGKIEENKLGEVWVNELRHAIPIIPRDFDSRELRQGQAIPDFHIAFSYVGPIAQPPHFLRARV